MTPGAVALLCLSAFSIAFLGCWQSRNVVLKRRGQALAASVLIGLCQIVTYKTVISINQPTPAVLFILFGALGAQLSMGWRRSE